jgi:DNA-binding transcriptional ArsR family regulator
MPGSQDRPPPFDHRLVRALDHPVRASFLRLLAERETLTPAQATELIGDESVSLANVVYHVRVLHGLGLIEATEEPDPRQSAPFRVTPNGGDALVALGISPS